jgi:hypothetical protein
MPRGGAGPQATFEAPASDGLGEELGSPWLEFSAVEEEFSIDETPELEAVDLTLTGIEGEGAPLAPAREPAREAAPAAAPAPAEMPAASTATATAPAFHLAADAVAEDALAFEEPTPGPMVQGGGAASLREAIGQGADGGEAALRAALSQASREVIEKIAWEVVPQLAEVIIREHVERLAKREDQKGA